MMFSAFLVAPLVAVALAAPQAVVDAVHSVATSPCYAVAATATPASILCAAEGTLEYPIPIQTISAGSTVACASLCEENTSCRSFGYTAGKLVHLYV